MLSPVEPLQNTHDLGAFHCGKQPLDEWLRKFALSSAASETAQTYVVHEERIVRGYFSICTGSLRREESTERIAKGQAARPIPAIVLARLAVDQSCQGQDLGSALLKDAMLRITAAADIVGARAVVVHAIDEDAKAFYLHFGFEESPIGSNQLMMLMKDLRHNLS